MPFATPRNPCTTRVDTFTKLSSVTETSLNSEYYGRLLHAGTVGLMEGTRSEESQADLPVLLRGTSAQGQRNMHRHTDTPKTETGLRIIDGHLTRLAQGRDGSGGVELSTECSSDGHDNCRDSTGRS